MSILMITSATASADEVQHGADRQPGQGLDSPVPMPDEDLEPQLTGDEILVHIRGDGTFVTDAQEISEDDLFEKLQGAVNARPDQAVILRMDGEILYEHTIHVLNICQKAGIWNVAFSTSQEQAEGTESVPPSANLAR